MNVGGHLQGPALPTSHWTGNLVDLSADMGSMAKEKAFATAETQTPVFQFVASTNLAVSHSANKHNYM
jgi:hypothetical protein